jgi:hypothetical protein
MRLIGFLLVLAGLALAVGYPLYQSDFTGTEFQRERIYDRAVSGNTRNWKLAIVELRENQNPLRIRLEGMRGDSDSYIGTNYPVTIDLTGPDGKVLSAARTHFRLRRTSNAISRSCGWMRSFFKKSNALPASLFAPA